VSDHDPLAFIRRVLAAYDGFDGPSADGELWWRTDGEYAPVSFFAICNDQFRWGSADLEPITPDNVHLLEQAIANCRAANPMTGACDATALFCSRARGMRPQGAYYQKLDKDLWPLFDAAGPPRDTDREAFGNPAPHPSERSDP
jgi:hypothetical protein